MHFRFFWIKVVVGIKVIWKLRPWPLSPVARDRILSGRRLTVIMKVRFLKKSSGLDGSVKLRLISLVRLLSRTNCQENGWWRIGSTRKSMWGNPLFPESQHGQFKVKYDIKIGNSGNRTKHRSAGNDYRQRCLSMILRQQNLKAMIVL
jgi:hypothetical protein